MKKRKEDKGGTFSRKLNEGFQNPQIGQEEKG